MTNTNDMTQYYKVLVAGKSCHGGTMDWSLPTTKRDGTAKAGKWMSVPNVDDIKVCNYGLHLTSDFARWLKPGCSVYEAEHDKIFGEQEDKIVTNRARLTREIERPDWWNRAEQFVATIPQVPFFKPDGAPKPEWKLFKAPTLAAAGDAAWDAARMAQLQICFGLPLDQKHIDHLNARWEVWQKGYGLLCDVNGVLYVYAMDAGDVPAGKAV